MSWRKPEPKTSLDVTVKRTRRNQYKPRTAWVVHTVSVLKGLSIKLLISIGSKSVYYSLQETDSILAEYSGGELEIKPPSPKPRFISNKVLISQGESISPCFKRGAITLIQVLQH